MYIPKTFFEHLPETTHSDLHARVENLDCFGVCTARSCSAESSQTQVLYQI